MYDNDVAGWGALDKLQGCPNAETVMNFMNND
jgi:hypothetical protein